MLSLLEPKENESLLEYSERVKPYRDLESILESLNIILKEIEKINLIIKKTS